MKYQAEIIVFDGGDTLYKSLLTERLDSKRSETTIKKDKKDVVFSIKASDSVALRATLNSITKLLDAYENISKVE